MRPSWATSRATVLAAIVVALVLVVGLAGWALSRSDRLGGDAPGGDPPGQIGVAWEAGLLSEAGDRLAVRFPGAAEGGDRPCGAWYVGLVGATLEGLRVTVITIPGSGPDGPADGSGCPAAAAAATTPRCAEVRLPYPPAERPVFDGVAGGAPPLQKAVEPGDLCGQLLGGS